MECNRYEIANRSPARTSTGWQHVQVVGHMRWC